MRTTSRPSVVLSALGALVLAAGLLAGCGSSGDSSSSSADEVSAAVDSGETSSGSGASSDAENPTDLLGYRILGEPGTEVEIEAVATVDGQVQPPLSQTRTVDAEPEVFLFSAFVDSAELTMEVTEGASATVEVVRGNAVDVDNPFAGVEVTETLDTVELTAGTPKTVTAG